MTTITGPHPAITTYEQAIAGIPTTPAANTRQALARLDIQFAAITALDDSIRTTDGTIPGWAHSYRRDQVAAYRNASIALMNDLSQHRT